MWLIADNEDWAGFANNDQLGYDAAHFWDKPYIAVNYIESNGTSGQRPLYKTGGPNGHSYISLDNNDAWIHNNGASAFLSSSGYTAFFVLRPQSAGGGACTEGGDGFYSTLGYVGGTFFNSGGSNKFCWEQYNGGYATINSTTTYSLNTWYIVEAWYDGTNINLCVNGDAKVSAAQSSPGTLANANSFRYGSAAFDLGEIMLFNVNIGSTKRGNYRTSLADSWGITVGSCP